MNRDRSVAGLDEAAWAGLRSALRERRLRAGEVLFRQGEPGCSLVILERGELVIRRADGDGAVGEEITLDRVGPGEVIGEMACLDPAPRSATVEAGAEALAWEMDRPVLEAVIEHAPETAAPLLGWIVRALAGRFRSLEDRLVAALQGGAGAVQEPARPTGDRPRGEPVRSWPDEASLALPGGLRRTDLEVLAGAGGLVRFRPEQALCREGDPAASCFLILQGRCEIRRRAGGRDRRLAELGPGRMVGETALTLEGQRSATVTAREEILALELPRDGFQRLLASASPAALRLQLVLAVQGVRQHRRMLRRVDRVLELRPDLRAAFPAGEEAPADLEGLLRDYLIGLREWGIAPSELDRAELVRPAGPSPGEVERLRRKHRGG